MNWPNTILILLAAFLAAFLEAVCPWPRDLLRVQVDVLPAVVVYASLSADITTVALVAVLGGLWFDSFSANPFGVSILPLFAAAFLIYPRRALILQEHQYARFILGLSASALAFLLTLLIQLSMHRTPLLGWGTIWQFIVMSIGGGLFTPVCFWVLGGLNRALTHEPVTESSFRPDREIRRGRN